MLALLAAPSVFAAAIALLWCARPIEVRTSLDELAGASGNAIPSAVRARAAALVPIVVSAPDFPRASGAAAALDAALRRPNTSGASVADCCAALRCRAGEGLADILDFVATNRAGLVSAADRAALATPEGRARIARRHAKRLYSDPSPPLFPTELDPFGLAEAFVRSQTGGQAGWTPREGWLTAETNGLACILVVLDLKPQTAADTDSLIAFANRLDAAIAPLRSGGVSIVACGVPIHTARTAARCKAQVGWLSAASLVFIAALALFAFRSIRWMPLLALSLATSALAGTLALLVCFRSVHLMTLVFGTTILGLVVDYSFHWLLQRPGGRATVTRSLVVSFATTEVSLAPLALSSLPVLRQSAAFLGAGLAAALVMVLFLYPTPSDGPADGAPLRWRLPGSAAFALKVACAVMAVVAAFGLARLRFATTPQALYRPEPDLAAAERFLAERSGAAGGERGMIVIAGGTLDERLAAEESLELPHETPHLSSILPSLSARRAAADCVSRLYAEQGAAHAELLGLASLRPPPAPRAWRESDLPAAVVRPFIAGGSLVVPSASLPARPLPDGACFWQPRQQLASMLSGWAKEARLRLGVSLLVLLALLAAIYRRAAVAVLAPPLAALAAVGAALGLCGEPANLFHLLAAFLLVGMGLDYAVFLRDGGAPALKPALCSLATSLVGFGMLAFVAFPVVRAFGFALGIGLPVAFAASCALAATPAAARARAARGAATEHAASPLGMEILFALYRVFGLRVLHALAAAVGLVAWTFSPGVRRAAPRAAKVTAFTRSLADKMVVMAGGRNLPKVSVEDSPDAESFLADVRAERGVFVLSSHVGTIEALAALGECRATFHAWMDIERTSVFNAFYLRHARRPRVKIHPISEIGLGTAFFAGDALERGDCLVMAGDRGRGAFRFAHALGAPVYFIACVADGPIGYRAIVRRLPSETTAMEADYAAAREAVAAAHPDQVFDWRIPGRGRARRA